MNFFAIVMVAIVFGNVGQIQAQRKVYVLDMFSATDRAFVGSFYLTRSGTDRFMVQLRMPMNFIAQPPFVSVAVYHRGLTSQEASFDPDPQNHCDGRYRQSDSTFFHGQQKDLADIKGFYVNIYGCVNCNTKMNVMGYSFVLLSHDPERTNPVIIACTETVKYVTTFSRNPPPAVLTPIDNGIADFPLNERDAETYLYSAEDLSHVGIVSFKAGSDTSVRARAVVNVDLGDETIVGKYYPVEYVQSGCRTIGYSLMQRNTFGYHHELTFGIHSEHQKNKSKGMILKFAHNDISLYKPEYDGNIMSRVLIIYKVLPADPNDGAQKLEPLMCGKIRPRNDIDEFTVDNFLSWAPSNYQPNYPEIGEKSSFAEFETNNQLSESVNH